jgi:hypothetical protein
VAHERPGGGAWPAHGDDSPEPRRKFAGDLDLELQCTVWDRISAYAKLE